MNTHVSFEMVSSKKRFITKGTQVAFYVRMNSKMFRATISRFKDGITDVAREQLLMAVRENMHFKIFRNGECLITQIAHKRTFTGVRTHMVFQLYLASVRHSTALADERFSVVVFNHVISQTGRTDIRHLADSTLVRFFIRVSPKV